MLYSCTHVAPLGVKGLMLAVYNIAMFVNAYFHIILSHCITARPTI